MFLVIFLQFLFACSFIIFKKTIIIGAPFFLVGVRMIIAGTILLLSQFFYDRKSFNKRLFKYWGLLLSAAVLNIYITNAYELWGIQYLTAAKSSFIYNISPFISAFLSYLFLKEKMSFCKWIGLIVGVIGFVPILFITSVNEITVNPDLVFKAELALLAAAIATAYGWISIKRLVYHQKFPVILVNGITMFIGGIISLTHSGLVESWPSIFNSISHTGAFQFWGYTLLVILISHIIAYNIYATLLESYSATFMSFAGFATPFFTALLGWFFLGETVSWQFCVSACIVFIGLRIFYSGEKACKNRYS